MSKRREAHTKPLAWAVRMSCWRQRPASTVEEAFVTDDRNHACTHSAKAKPEGSDEVRNCHCRSREHDAETSHA